MLQLKAKSETSCTTAARDALIGAFWVLTLLSATPVQAQELSIETSLLDAPGGLAETGANFRYRVTYACNLVVGDCENATITIDLPPEVEFVPPAFFPPGDVASAVHDGSPTGGTVTFTYQPTVPAGNAGDLDITVRFPAGSTPDGTATTMNTDAVTSIGDPPLITQMADLPPVTSSATPMADIDVALQDGFLDSCQSPGPPGAFPSTYQVTIGPSTAAGSLDFVDVTQLVLTLPLGVDSVVPMDGGIYNAVANTVTWSSLGAITLGNSVTVSVELNFPQPPFSNGQTVTATANASVDVLDAPPDPALVPFGPLDFMDTLEVFGETTEAMVSKAFGDNRPATLPPAEGQDFSYVVSISNTGNLPLDTLSVVDDGDGALGDIAAGIDVTRVTTGAYDPAPTSVTINVTGDMGSTPSITSPDGTSNTPLDLTGLLMPGERVIRIEWVFNGGAPVGMAPTTPARINATANVGFPAGTVVDNHVTANWTATPTMPSPCGGVIPPPAGSDTDNFPYTVADSYTYLNPNKNETSAGPYFPLDIVTFSFDVENSALANDPAPGVVVTDLLPEFLDFQTGTNTEDFTLAPGVSLGMFEEIDNYNGTGRTLLRWTLTGDLDPGETVAITFDAEVQVGVIFGTQTNVMGMTYPAGVDQVCASGSSTDPADLDGDTDTGDIQCSDSEDFEIAAVAALPSSKFVMGQCDAGFANPGPGTSLPGGIVDWRVEVSNSQTVPMGNFVLIDILPFVGDTGVKDPSARLSLFRPLLIEPITPPPGGAVFYSLSGNPCRPEVGGPTSGCDAPNWTTIPPTPITDTMAVKIEFGDLVLNPLDVLAFTWRMVLPADAPIDGSEAFNSFAFGSNRQDDGGFLSAEPNKVGIDATCMPVAPDDAMLGDFVWLDANGDGDQDGGAEIGINNVPVQLFDPGPDGLPRTGDDVLVLSTITADDDMGNPGWYKFSALSPGDYYVQFTPPANFEVTAKDAAGEAVDSDADPISACTDVVTLAPSEVNLDVDMGLLAPVTASLGNYVWFDRDGDGVQNEPLVDGVNGVTVKLFVDDGDDIPEPGGDDGTPIQVTVTADDSLGNPGFYSFEGLTPGVPYFVQFMLPPTATGFTARNAAGDDSLDSDAALGNGATRPLTLAAGEDNRTRDAGLTPLAGTLSLGNVVWMDDGDDVFDALSGDMPLSGVRLNLYRDSSGDGLPQVDEFSGSTVTATLAGKMGRYRFDDLSAGDYIVEIPASNFAAGEPLAGKISVPFSTVDPNDDVDHDDAGDTLGTVVVSAPITLSIDGEPTPDADDDLEDDNDVNFTLDFGFVVGVAADYDFGDAPDAGTGTAQGNYETVVFDGGAFHELADPMGPYLGACVDSDDGMQQNFAAGADDFAGALAVTYGTCATAGDDEDGVSFAPGLLMVGGTVDVTVTSASANPCLVSGWIDWNQDGTFDDFAPEKILTDVAPGAFPGIAIPAAAVPGFTYARFRCSTAGGDGPIGASADGEVEDYRLQLRGVDFGDAPDSYGTLLPGGAVHDTDPNVELYLGSCVDTEPDGLPATFPAVATGDDSSLGTSRIGDCLDDEDGITFDTMLVRGEMATITATASVPDPPVGMLDAWIDFDGSGTFEHPGEHLFAGVSQSLVTGSNSLPAFLVPATAVPGTTYARFRMSSAGGLLPIGMAADGEIEDYEVVIKGFDFGDLPDATYPTELGSGGAQHIVDPESLIYLGACADPEDDGVSSVLADGDDLGADNGNTDTGTAGTCVGNDDEDGVTFNTMIVACQTATITVDANTGGQLDAWIDFDPTTSPGFDATDQIVTDMTLTAGNNVLNIPVPCTADVNVTSYARFRFSSAGGLNIGGVAMDGEVEDYTVFLKGSDFGDAPDSYDTTNTAGGPKHGVDARAGNEFLLGACADTEGDGPAAGTAAEDDGSVATSTAGTCAAANDDEDGIAFDGGMAMAGACTTNNGLTVTLLNNAGALTSRLDAWIDWNGDGDFDHPAEHLFGGTSAVLADGANALTYDVPCDAVPQSVSYARFRLSSTGSLLPGGASLDGEVEDYAFQVKGVDFGDAPDTYGTTLSAALGDASHTIVPGYRLGSAEDTESDGQPSADADGDDTAGVDDEDGVAFDGGMAMAGACTTGNGVDVTLTNTAGIGTAFLDAWIDFDGSGTFDDPSEHLFGGTSQALSVGVNSLSYDVPCDAATQAMSYARFRLSSTGGLSPADGAGIDPIADGEVEDYTFQVKGIDFGDAPDSYGTTQGAPLGDASHTIVPGYGLGAAVDSEDDGLPSADADGDDTDGMADEDGVAFDGGMAMAGACTSGNGVDVVLTNTAGVGSALLDVWIDFDGDGSFDDPSEHLFGGTSQALAVGTNSLSYDVPCDAVPQTTSYARFRLSSTGSLSPADGSGVDPIADGEVEDYVFQIKGTDYGDAPDTYGTTRASAQSDASHVIVDGYQLGAAIDSEDDGQPSADADGDDTAGTADEDGVAFAGGMAMAVACSTSNDLDVTLTDSAGLGSAFLDAWIDFDGDGTFDDPSEHLFAGASQALSAGVNSLSYDVPCSAVEQTVSYARFRLSSTGGLAPTDGAGVDPVADGEVEDYVFQIKGIDLGDAPDTYSTTIASGGAAHGVDPANPLHLGSCVDTEADGAPAIPPADAIGDDTTAGNTTSGICAVADDDEDGVSFTTMLIACESVTVEVNLTGAAGRLDAWLDFDGDGDFTAAADQIFTSEALVAGSNSLSFDVPCTAAPGLTYSRFRLSSAGVASFDGAAPDGEVEDYQVLVKGADFGDAPDSYATLFATDGPRHGVDPASSLYLGVCVDTEADGQETSGDASDDDTTAGSSVTGTCTGIDDEDGVVFDTLITACKQAQITVTAAADGLLDAWIDYDADGGFNNIGDQIFASEALTAGANVLSFDVPCTAAAGTTYARFRLSSAGGLSFDGAAPDGEVEDYQIGTDDADFGDAPDSYGTTFAAGGAVHGLDPGANLYLGSCIDSEVDGQPVATADGDDLGVGTTTFGTCAVANDDEDGVAFDTMLIACQSASVTVTSTAAGFVDAWIDFDADGTFVGASDQIFISEPVVAGTNSLSFTLPCTVAPGQTYARFRLSSAGGLASGGTTPNGEVEDYQVLVKGSDFGDAPDSFSTLFASGGPVHGVDPSSSLYLGACVDSENEAESPLDATGDDSNSGTGTVGTCVGGDDEDGVTFDTMIIACQSADLTVTAGAAGVLDAFFDFDGDGTFGGGEQIFASQALAAGANSLSFDVPCDAALGTAFTRFRLSSTGGLGSGGPSTDGEVEDYAVTVKGSDFGDAPDSYSTTDGSNGPVHGVDTTASLYLGACVDTETDAQAPLDGTGDDQGAGTGTTGTCASANDDEDGVTFDTMLIACDQADLTITASTAGVLDAWIDFGGDGSFAEAEDQVFGSEVLSAGANSLSFDVPCDADDGASYARFRFSSAGGLTFDGPSMDGEVEDYPVLLKGADFGDAPDSYTTLLGSNGPFHGLDPAANLYLGVCVDGEPDGQPTASAAGDDTDVGTSLLGTCSGDDDEDGVTFDSLVIASQEAQITVTASAAGLLDAWVDFNGDGSFSEAADQIFASEPLVAGDNVLTFLAPADTTDGSTYARFRFSSVGGLTFSGPSVDGEVEDYLLVTDESDFGDAPDSYGTLFTSGGPLHGLDAGANLYLGACVDAETEGQPSAGATEDDVNAGLGAILGTCVGDDDEDGVSFDTMVVACESSDLTVTASAAGLLDAWIDFDLSGVFDASEQIFASEPLVAGANSLSFTSPCDAAPGNTVTRFRLSSAGGLATGGPAVDGEVEDHVVEVKGADLGDAPDSYSTLFASDGPRHAVDPALDFYLGACVDSDADGQPSASADADDSTAGTGTVGTCTGIDDEDGVAFTSEVTACKLASITVTASAAGLLDAWIDFDRDGTFTNLGTSSDQIFAAEPLAAGSNSLSFMVPCDALTGDTYARFRFSSAGGLSFDGAAADGEVEDYLVASNESDFGDAPDSYATLFASGGPVHGVVPGGNLYLGACVDSEAEGQPTAGADGDDLNATSELGTCVGGDDEDGVTFDSMLIACGQADLTVTASTSGVLDAWIDFGADGSFATVGDQIFASQGLVAGSNSLSFIVPCDADDGISYARFRLSSAGGLSFGGTTPDGEVEDYPVLLKTADFGDAPDSYVTVLGSNGPFHGLDPAASLYLGACVDGEPDGQPSANADGDDTGVGTGTLGTCVGDDDEDGVTFDTMVTASQVAQITVTASTAGLLDAWVDFGGDGTFSQVTDQIFASESLGAGANVLTFLVPADAVEGMTYARFRFSSAGALGFSGPAVDGEVEDYLVVTEESDFGDAPDSYGTLFASGGPLHGLDADANLYLGACVDAETEGQPSGDATEDDLSLGLGAILGTCVDNDDEDGVSFDSMVVACESADLTIIASARGLLDAWVDFDRSGDFDASEQIFASEPLTAGTNSLSFTSPCDAVPGDTMTRFRLSSAGGLDTGGPAVDGEVEDHQVEIKGADFGDAPDSYATLFATNGPRHAVDPALDLFLGVCVDSDADGQASAGADADDLNAGTSTVGTCVGIDDEDGVAFTSEITACKPATVTVTASAGGLLDAWIDFDLDGTFTNAGPSSDQIFAAEPLVAGTNALTFLVPCDAVDGANTYARFRFSSAGGLPFDGAAEDGEVEDYLLSSNESDFGDAPDSYGTLFTSGGPVHGVVPGIDLYLGTCVDSEIEGQPTVGADGDDLNATTGLGTCIDGDDEDGVTFDSMLIACGQADLTVTASADGVLDAWIDFGADGVFDASDRVFAGQAVNAGSNSLSFMVPCDVTPDDSYARFRLSLGGVDGPGGTSRNGEVEDHRVLLKGLDLGDAPDSYTTTFAAGGPFHGLDPATSVFLGACVDSEADGQPGNSATGDDVAAGTSMAGTCAVPGDDEDGVVFETPVTACQSAQLTVSANVAGQLSAWIDYDGDGAFDLPRDQVFTDEALSAGDNELSFFVPCDAAAADSYARFRFSSAGVGTSFGGASNDGEVEDYLLLLRDSDFGDAPDSYGTLLASGGPLHGLDPVENLYLGVCVDSEAEGQPSDGADGDDLGGGLSDLGDCADNDDEDGVVFETDVNVCLDAEVTVTASAEGVLNAWVDFGGDGTFDAADQIFTDVLLMAGANALTFPVPCDAFPGESYSRFRFSSTAGLPMGGPARDGEVEDYALFIKGFDFGDAPDPDYPTLFASDGARHVVLAENNPTLGVIVDIEPDGLPSADHRGDDSDGFDDEDGVIFNGLFIPNAPASIDVETGATGGFLNAWIDYDQDGSWDDPGEQVVTDLALGPNLITTLELTVPAGATLGETCARFRISSTAGLQPTGQALDGEVEDYRLIITEKAAAIGLSKEIIDVQRVNPEGTFDVAFRLIAENLGNIEVNDLQVVSDLATAFTDAVSFFVAEVSSSELTVNPAFDGDGDANLLVGTDSLAPGELGEIFLVVNVDPGAHAGPYICTAVLRGVSDSGTEVVDVSNDGDDPDPNGDGDPQEDQPTILNLPLLPIEIPTVGGMGLIVMALLLAAIAASRLRRQHV